MLPSWSNFFGEFSTFTSLWWIDVWFNVFPSEEIPGWLEYFKHVLSSCLFFCGVLSALLELDGVLPCPIFWFCIFLPGAFLDLSFPFILLCAKEIGSSLNFGSGGDIRFPNDNFEWWVSDFSGSKLSFFFWFSSSVYMSPLMWSSFLRGFVWLFISPPCN